MPITFTFHNEHGFFVSTWFGVISDADLLQSYRELLEDERFKPGLNEIADTRKAQIGGVTADAFYRLNSMVEQHLAGKTEGFKTAVIASTDVNYGTARIYDAASDSSTESVLVFRKVDDALKWIGVEGFTLD